ncbi:multiple coagulation factor deficiency protein 2 homolog [Palaemon carinicauda]|uniref:multiple coagulation factor deficiency protein 2 homolog n=1 Tax=Palaemon carinicauda TaxID=392227 RepID=UPI0035B5BA16
MRVLLVTAIFALQVFLCSGTGSHGAGSHYHMREGHRHVRQDDGPHRHHVPQRSVNNVNERHDPKKPPPTLTNPKLLGDSKLVHDKSHIAEELPSYITPERIKEMTPRELDYHYFKIHDFDDNRRLDGLELLQALGHIHGHDEDDDDNDDDEEKFKLLNKDEKEALINLRKQKQEEEWTFYVELIDAVFKEYDRNQDGYLNYGEYIIARNRDNTEGKLFDSMN